MRDRVLRVHVADPAGGHDQRPRSVAAAGQAPLHRGHEGRVLHHGGGPVQVDDLLLLGRRLGAVEPPLPDQQGRVHRQRDPAERVDDLPRVALDRRRRPGEEGGVAVGAGLPGPGRPLRRRSLRRVVDEEPPRGDAVAAGVDHPRRERLVHVGAVVALVVVLHRQLPVGGDPPGAPGRQHPLAGVGGQRQQAGLHAGRRLRQRRRAGVQVHVQEPGQGLHPHRRHAQLAHVLAPGVQQPPAEAVGPGVVRAGDAVDGVRLDGDQFVAAVLADVVEGAHHPGVVRHDHALVADGGGDQLARRRHL